MKPGPDQAQFVWTLIEEEFDRRPRGGAVQRLRRRRAARPKTPAIVAAPGAGMTISSPEMRSVMALLSFSTISGDEAAKSPASKGVLNIEPRLTRLVLVDETHSTSDPRG